MTDGIHAAALRATAGHDQGHAHGPRRARHADSSHTRQHDERRSPEHTHRHRGSTIFAQEAKAALARRFPEPHHGRVRQSDRWHDAAESPTPERAASTLVDSAKRIIARQGHDASATIAEIEQEVRTAAATARLVVRAEGEHTEIDAALKYFESSLTTLGTQAADEKSAHVSARLRQGARIQIRTQEGDVVELRLRRAVTTRATAADGNSTPSEVSLSTRLGLRLEVNGDINDSELAAITAVFEQAASIAEAFFDGDLAAAFETAVGFAFDSEQLATVSLAFKVKVRASTTYAALAKPTTDAAETSVPPAIGAAAGAAPSATGAAGAADPANPVATLGASHDDIAPPTDADGPTSTPPASAPAAASNVEEGDASTASPETEAPNPAAPTRIDSLADLTRLVAEFFTALIAGLEQLQAGTDEDTETSYRLATAFKLEVLQSVLRVGAPAEHSDAAAAAATAIEDGAYGPNELRASA